MKNSPRWIILLIVAAFIGFVVYSSLSRVTAQCEVCVTFNGRTNCATAAGASEQEARTAAQTTACGPISAGMAESVNCQNAVPTRAQCTAP